MKQYVNTNTINIVGAVVVVGLSVSLAYSAITKNASFASKWDYSVSELAKVNSKHIAAIEGNNRASNSPSRM